MKIVLIFLCTIVFFNANASLTPAQLTKFKADVDDFVKKYPLLTGFYDKIRANKKNRKFALRGGEFKGRLSVFSRTITNIDISMTFERVFEYLAELFEFPIKCGIDQEDYGLYIAFEGIAFYMTKYIDIFKRDSGETSIASLVFPSILVVKCAALSTTNSRDKFTTTLQNIRTEIGNLQKPEVMKIMRESRTFLNDLNKFLSDLADAIDNSYKDDMALIGFKRFLTEARQFVLNAQQFVGLTGATSIAYETFLLTLLKVVNVIEQVSRTCA